MHVSSLYQKPSESRDNARRIDGRGSTAEIRLNRGLGSRQPGRIVMMLQKPLQVCIRPASSNPFSSSGKLKQRVTPSASCFFAEENRKGENETNGEKEGEEESWKSDIRNHYILIKTRRKLTNQSNSETNSP